MLSLYEAKTKRFSFFSVAECQICYQTPKTNTRQQEQAGVIYTESCYWQSLDVEV